MRGWLAALAFVPAVAWGQSPQDCVAGDADPILTRIVMNLLEVKDSGATEREMTQAALDMDEGPKQVIYLEAVQHLYGPREVKISTVVNAMKVACYEYMSGR